MRLTLKSTVMEAASLGKEAQEWGLLFRRKERLRFELFNYLAIFIRGQELYSFLISHGLTIFIIAIGVAVEGRFS